jgi:tRNA nucleotidyltransferase (CCA-adding enzyme)
MITSEEVIDRLCKSGFDTYIVGGAVRDMFIGMAPEDEDIVTSATPDEIIELFSDCKVKGVGKSFNVMLIDDIEVATFRVERYISDEKTNRQKVEVQTARTIEEDLKRRDFTCNALAFCQYTGEVIDLFEGLEDLKNRLVKFVGDPYKRIHEDPVRIIRACRFIAKLGGKFEESTRLALQNKSYLIEKNVAKERIRIEILKVMKNKKASQFFHALHDIDGLKYVFPSLECCYDYNRKEMHGIYHNETILEHCYMCGDYIPTKYPLLKLTGYLHDVGKVPACRYEPETKTFSFKTHDRDGKDIVEKELRKLRFHTEEVRYITALIDHHMRSFYTVKSTRKLLRILNEYDINYNDFIRLKIGDRLANKKKKGFTKQYIQEFYEKIKEAQKGGVPKNHSYLVINGNDIMEVTGLKPGEEVGKIKDWLLDLVTDDPSLNEKGILIKLIKQRQEGGE